MAGVFDSLMSDDPKEQAYMALAAGLLSGRGNFNKVAGEALMSSQNVYRQAQEVQRQGQQDKLMEEYRRAQMTNLLAEAEARKKQEVKSPLRTVGNAIYDETTGKWLTPPEKADKDKAETRSEYQKLMERYLDQTTPEIERGLIKQRMEAINYRQPAAINYTYLSDAFGNQVATPTRQPAGMPPPKSIPAPPKAPALMPPSLVKAQDELVGDLKTAERVNAILEKQATALEGGTTKLGPVTTPANVARNVLGASNEQSRAYGSLRGDLNKMRNDSLRLNKGAQTEGDAVRAWDEVNQFWLTDTKLVAQRLREIQKYNNDAIAEKKQRINLLRVEAGVGDAPAAPAGAPSGASPAAKVRVYNPATGLLE